MKKRLKIKKIDLPLKKMSLDEVGYAAGLMEDMNHNFKAFWEVLDGVRKKEDATFDEVGNVKGELVIMNRRLDNIEQHLKLSFQ